MRVRQFPCYFGGFLTLLGMPQASLLVYQSPKFIYREELLMLRTVNTYKQITAKATDS